MSPVIEQVVVQASAEDPVAHTAGAADPVTVQAADAPPAAPAAPSDAGGATPAGGAAPSGAAPSSGNVEALAQQLFPAVMRRLKAELLVDRERRGIRTDPW
ncbi:hypothetical protein FHP29_12610 [Nocardioides albidus]|uniref:Uncharacterized protein n=1 Tax=Nocardioides albidus TaxID=1517589 RepID=A0A5C4VUW1_9ACTN|nr:hypothetical protein FHP29_12610 [Nocardioides albidus]